MAKAFFGARYAALWNPATGDTVRLSKLASERTNFKRLPLMVTTNVQRENGSRFTQSVATFDIDNLPTVKAWALAGTEIKCVVVGYNSLVYWGESVPVMWEGVVKQNTRDGMTLWAFTLDLTDASDTDVHECVNLIEQLYPWGDITGQLPTGAIVSGDAFFGSFSGSSYTALCNLGVPQNSGAYYRIELPASGMQFTWTVGFETASYAFAPNSLKVKVIQRNLSGTSISTHETSITTDNTRYSVTFMVACSAYYIVLYIFGVINWPDGDSLVFNNPSLRVGTDTAFVEY